MSDPTNVPSFDESGATLSGNGENQEVDIENGNLEADPDLDADPDLEAEPGAGLDDIAHRGDDALTPGSTATGDPTSR